MVLTIQRLELAVLPNAYCALQTLSMIELAKVAVDRVALMLLQLKVLIPANVLVTSVPFQLLTLHAVA